MDFDIDRDALFQTFLSESEEGLAMMEEALVGLESRPDDGERLAAVFRVAHTLKGNASSLGFQSLVRLSHTLEDLLDRLRDRVIPVTPALVTLLLEAVDALRGLVPAAVNGSEALTAAHEQLLLELSRRAGGGDDPPPSAGSGGSPFGEGHASPEPAHSAEHRSLRVDTDRLDRMLDLTGEIAIARGRLRRMLEQHGAPAPVLEAQGEVDRLSLDLQELVMKVRLVPLRGTFRGFVRTVRDLAARQGKQARLILEGEDVEVDTSVIEQARDPLTHMIRNALDHGIEPPDVRRRAGKDPCGTLALRARHEGATIVIEIADDGAGLNRQRILERARERGIDAEHKGEEEIQRLVFEPGFSTAETVTELSGRGIGLDVVRRNVTALRGKVGIQSQEGIGTTITLRLPLTLAIIDGFVVGVGDEAYVIPLEAVVECLELPPDASSEAGGDGVINLRGAALPYLRLRRLFGLGAGGRGHREHVVVVRPDAGRRVGIVVDHLEGGFQTVIKPLGRLLQGLPGIAGSAILGTGRVALILDVPALLAETVRGQGEPRDGELSAPRAQSHGA
jgi:two-component system chemotaxis sensor kinase CheA